MTTPAGRHPAPTVPALNAEAKLAHEPTAHDLGVSDTQVVRPDRTSHSAPLAQYKTMSGTESADLSLIRLDLAEL